MLPRSLAAAARLPAAARRRLLHRGSAGGGGAEEQVESMAYRMSMLRAPSVVRKKGILSCNSCSLIGRLDAPVRPCKGRSEEDPLAYTFLSVRHSSSSSSSRSSDFHGDLANVGLKYLKHDDLVYVYGFLSSYHKVSPRGERHIFYKIHVKELNYVLDHNKKSRNSDDSVDPASTPSADTQVLEEDKYKDRLRLWQVFFASPYEWWDNRQSKPHVKYADFKHRDTREKLWLHPDDPPWVRRQLELHDQETAVSGRRDARRRVDRGWNTQDFSYSDEWHNDEQETQRQANA
ncbi:protein OSB1, mitochondrial isoform X2 [Brachypodium distachyon]|uniref:protein OSB1, mitochondrial isoform X2 n=1 Tax=Brachypodium distachyon TaxID=15368 RepID=UPI000D0DCDAD|nr:protein OSB1, mitochondrial isoform X2 [Brachypodium distachyon]|eukprot:XP_024312663.1 protein OSB1, mitochondrial isoform X2 [Brachypodium distachyon]